MATSQRTFESRYGRFKNGNELIQAKSNYNPNNALIKKLDLTQFIETVALKDKSVNSTNTLYREKVGLRRINGFKGKKNLEDCLESRLQNVLSYVGAEIGRTVTPCCICRNY